MTDFEKTNFEETYFKRLTSMGRGQTLTLKQHNKGDFDFKTVYKLRCNNFKRYIFGYIKCNF